MRGKLRRIERAASEHYSEFACPVCGEAFRYAGDLALDVLVADWALGAAGTKPAPATVARVLDHEHPELVDEVLRDIPALRDAR